MQIPLLQIKNNISDSGNDIWLLLTFLFENISNLLNHETSIISCITFFIDSSFINIVAVFDLSFSLYVQIITTGGPFDVNLQITWLFTPQYFSVIVLLRVTVKLPNLGDLTLIQYCN